MATASWCRATASASSTPGPRARAVPQGELMGSFGGGSTRTASVRTALGGVSPTTLQRIADEAHADLLQQLHVAGFTVATPEEAAQAAAEAPRVAGNALDGAVGSTLLGGASTAWRTLAAGAAPLIQGQAGESAAPGTLRGLSAIGGGMAAQRVADASNGGLALFPLLRLDYVDVQSSGRSLLAGRANAKATPRFAVATSTRRRPRCGGPGWARRTS